MTKLIDAARGMTWVRLDCAFPRNPKVLDLVHARAFRAVTVYISGLAYSGEHGLAGFLPASCLPYLHATTANAAQLVDVGLWEPQPGGWDIHDWDAYQPAADEADRRRDKAKKAAEARWARQRAAQLAEGGGTNGHR